VSEENLEDHGESVRIDAWAWAVRLFRTRSLASAACRKEQLRVNGQRCRPSRRVRVGDRVEVRRDTLTRTLEVKALLTKRVGAKHVEDYLVDRTPPEDYVTAAEISRRDREETPRRESGTGRPTKRERRRLDQVRDREEDDSLSFEEFVRAYLRNR